MPITRVPDALMLCAADVRRGAARDGERLHERVARVSVKPETILGGRPWIRIQPNGRLFVTRDPADAILFPRDHARSGQPRYRWEKQSDGSEWGYLVEEAESAQRVIIATAGV